MTLYWFELLEILFKLFNGSFIKMYELRIVWRVLTYGTLIIALFVYVISPLMDWWQGVVDYLNYIRWYSK